jgi:hypothetical protein
MWIMLGYALKEQLRMHTHQFAVVFNLHKCPLFDNCVAPKTEVTIIKLWKKEELDLHGLVY